MTLRRRPVLAGLALAAGGAAPAPPAPGDAPHEDGPHEDGPHGDGPHGRVRLLPEGGTAGFVLAAAEADARLDVTGAPALPLPGRPVAAAALPVARRQVLACDTALPDGEVLCSLVGADRDGLRLLAVECREWRETGRRRLSMRLEAVPDDRRLLLRYEATDGARRESWTDALAWNEGGPLRSEPLRPVLAGTMQARMAEVRARVLALLAVPRRELTLAMLRPTGLLDPLGWVQAGQEAPSLPGAGGAPPAGRGTRAGAGPGR